MSESRWGGTRLVGGGGAKRSEAKRSEKKRKENSVSICALSDCGTTGSKRAIREEDARNGRFRTSILWSSHKMTGRERAFCDRVAPECSAFGAAGNAFRPLVKRLGRS